MPTDSSQQILTIKKGTLYKWRMEVQALFVGKARGKLSPHRHAQPNALGQYVDKEGNTL
jgi:hypothetical protein